MIIFFLGVSQFTKTEACPKTACDGRFWVIAGFASDLSSSRPQASAGSRHNLQPHSGELHIDTSPLPLSLSPPRYTCVIIVFIIM